MEMEEVESRIVNGSVRFRWKIRSMSDARRKYTLAYQDGRWMCGCRGWIFHRHCKHIEEAQLQMPALKPVQGGR